MPPQSLRRCIPHPSYSQAVSQSCHRRDIAQPTCSIVLLCSESNASCTLTFFLLRLYGRDIKWPAQPISVEPPGRAEVCFFEIDNFYDKRRLQPPIEEPRRMQSPIFLRQTRTTHVHQLSRHAPQAINGAQENSIITATLHW